MLKRNPTKSYESGITLIALIITVIVLVILAAVSISAVYNSGVVNYAINGTMNYAEAGVNENRIMQETESILESAISKIEGIMSGEGTTKGLEVGDYVAYTPDSSVANVLAANSGYTSDQSFTTDTSVKWRVLKTENNIVTLIADKEVNTSPTLYLSGADGYNNGVKILNDMCSALYSNTSLGLTARSIKIEDIEAISSYDKTTFTDSSTGGSYGTEYTSSYTQYPNIYAQEKTGYVDTAYGTTLGQSEQTSYVTGSNTATTLKGRTTSYYYTMSTSYMSQSELNTITSSGTPYWLASRTVGYLDGVAYYGLHYASR